MERYISFLFLSILLQSLQACSEIMNKFLVDLMSKPNSMGSFKTLIIVTENLDSNCYALLTEQMWKLGINVLAQEELDLNILEDNCHEQALVMPFGNTTEQIEKLLFTSYLQDCSWLLPNETIVWDKAHNLRLDCLIYVYELSGNGINVFEIYSIKSKFTVSNDLFKWNESNRDSTLGDPNKIWMRRSNFYNLTLVNTGLFWMDIYTVYYDKDDEPIGFFPEVLERFQELMNFNVKYIHPKDLEWGFRFPNGTWNGIMDQLINEDVDMAATGLTILEERSESIDFTIGVLRGEFSLFVGVQPNPEINWTAFLHIFEPTIWLSTACFMIVLAMALAYAGDKSLSSALAFQFQLLAQRGSWLWDEKENKVATKQIFIFSCIFSFIIFSYYTADLTSLMTSGPAKSPIHSFQDVLDRDLTLIWSLNTASEQIMAQADKSSAMYKVYKKMFKNPDFQYFYDWKPERKRAEVLHSSTKYISYGSTTTVKRYGVKVLNVEETSYTYLGIGVKKNSEFRKIFNYYLIHMRERGILQEIELKWLQGRISRKEIRDKSAVAITLSYQNLLFPFITLMIGIMTAILFLILEMAKPLIM